MSQHSQFEALLPVYVSGALTAEQHAQVESHIRTCAACQADLALWRALASEIQTEDRVLAAPPSAAEVALARLHTPPGVSASNSWRAAWQRTSLLLQAQMHLVRQEIWPASAAVTAIGIVAAYLLNSVAVIHVLAPLVAAACLSLLFGPENDPAFELSLACPTSPRQILLARLALVFGYNLLLGLAASLLLLPLVPAGMLGSIILGWLGPMAFLASLALLLSLLIGTGNAVALAYLVWLSQYFLKDLIVAPLAALSRAAIFNYYLLFWTQPALLLASAGVLFAMGVWLAGRQIGRLTRWA